MSIKINATDIPVGNSIVRLLVQQHNQHTPFLIRLHGDEKEARKVGRWWVEHHGGTFLDVGHDKREVEFNFRGAVVSFDPNRIFSKVGIKMTLEEYGSPTDSTVMEEVEQYSRAILGYCDLVTCIIALHNNKDFNINYYLAGGENYDPAVRVHANPNEHPNNLVLVTEEQDFNRLKEHNLNVILECANSQDHPGSLSDYCRRRKMRYFNIETQHGELEKQKTILRFVVGES